MSNDIKVFIEKEKLPSKEVWQEAILENGFDLVFDEAFNPVTLQGFLPCKLQNESCGFEYYNDVLEDTMFSPSDSQKLTENCICISFNSSFEQLDISSAMIAAGTLVKLANGLYWVMGQFEENEDPIQMAKFVLENGIN